MIRIDAHTYMLEVDHLSPALLVHEGRALLFDACLPGQFEPLCAALGEAGGIERLTAIALTHQDIDHIGCVVDLLAARPGLRVYASDVEAPYVRGEKTPTKLQGLLDHEADLTPEQATALDRLRRGFARCQTRVVEGLCDGDDVPGFPARLVLTPGHTPGHACYYLPEARTLIAGDTLSTDGGALTLPNPVHTLDMELLRASLARLIPLDIERVVCYHGGLFEGDVRGALEGLAG